MESPELTVIFTASYKNVSIVAATVSGYARACGFDEPGINQVELCFSEAANNIVQHAYGNADNEKIQVDIYKERSALVLALSDQGCATNSAVFDRQPDWDNLDPTDESTWDENGRGVQLVKELMDIVDYQSVDNKNTLLLKKYF